MEESGQNWPSYSDLGVGDLSFDDEEVESDSFEESIDPMMLNETKKNKREMELNERLLALSATIPGLKKKKMDKTSILDKASNYVKQLQQHVRELEQQVGSQSCKNNETSSCIEVNSDYYGEPNDDNILLPEVKVRVLHKEVLIIIHCEKQKSIMLKILSHLENLHLSMLNNSVLPFGKSTLDITIITQMGDGYIMTTDELVNSLRLLIITQ
ncbi:hypothetical protein Lal_00023632 [Lupinus albus]|uniref:Putative transcription factor bHLH family n=1 Tax=Lupinus albus TaxID=3870 RepID=A0A6A5PL16_LUPAL|nr:putative transcription factor bHLH family [Lupinus albus]KAF1898627.1 hypothetical protein Lal_00023632 [Lupinus albus]